MEFLNIVYVIAVVLFSHEAASNSRQQEFKEIQDPSLTTTPFDYFSGGVERATPVLYRIPVNSTGQPREISPSAPRRLLPKKLDLVLLRRHRKQSLRMRVHRMRDVLGSHTRVEWTEGEEMESRVLSSRCIYHGKVDGMENSQATVDLCNDIRGVIRTDSEDIYLEPMTDATSHSFDEGGIKDDDDQKSFNGTHFVRIHRRSGEGKVDDDDDRLRTDDDDHVVIDLSEDTIPSHTTTHNGTDEENNGSSSSDRHHRRQKRQTPHRGPRHMQVLLVTDSSLVRFHGRNLIEQYLLTQMSIVDSIYHHPSLGFEVNMVVVKIKIIDDSVVRRLVVRGDGKESLDRFCQWANNEKPKTRNRDEDFDVAVYITKEEIGPAGFAPVTGMCVPLRSCALVKDDGTSSAFVIAHEIGHIFGMIHDGHGNKCGGDPLDGNIMASMVQSNFHTYYWSQCNKDAMEKYLVDVHCLDDKPKDPLWPVYSQPFGQSWTLDEQCRQEFGAGFSLCRAFDHLDPCIHLWCSHSSNTTLCKTKRGPPLPGTSCGRGKWCMNGSCLEKRSVAVDGGWSSWQKWGECSRTCGIGIQFRVRYCNQPRPKHGGRDCRGDREEFRTCNTQGCPHLKDFRAEQCAEFNDKRFDGSKRHNWQPHENKNASEMCKVTCISEETKTIFVSESNAVDGTFCSYDQPNQVCVKGRCEAVGCDGVLNSRQREDQCGYCGGNGASCKRVSGYFTDPLSKQEYHRLLVVPPGARNIMITERQSMPHLAHFIAVRDSKTEAWYLNGNTQQEQSRHFVVHGTSFTYSNKQRDGETLTAKGPLLSPLDIMVYSMSSKLRPVIDYEYAIPASSAPIEKLTGLTRHSANSSRYVWAVSGWTNCSKPCGSGIQFEVFSCVDTEKRSYSDGFCSQLNKPRPGKQECNTKECSLYTYWWDADDWSAAPPCSASCGTHGVQQRRIQCVTDNKGQTKPMSPGYCNQRLMPNYVQTCNRFPCTTEAPTLPPTSTISSLAPTTPSTPERQTVDTTPAVSVSQEASESEEVTVPSNSRNPQEHDITENSEEQDLGTGHEIHLSTKMADSVPKKLTSRSTDEPTKVSSSLGLVRDENNGRRSNATASSSSLQFLSPTTTTTATTTTTTTAATTTTRSRSSSPTDRRFTSEEKLEPTSTTVAMKRHSESDDFANSIESELGKDRPIEGKTGQEDSDGKPNAAAELTVTTRSPNGVHPTKHPDPVASRYRDEKTEHEVPKVLPSLSPSDVRGIKDSMNSTGFQRHDPSTRANASSSSSSVSGDTVDRSIAVSPKVKTTITRRQSRRHPPVSLHLGQSELPLRDIRPAPLSPTSPPPTSTSPSPPPTSPPPSTSPSPPPPTSPPSTSPSPPPTSPPPTTVTTPAADNACLEDRSIFFCQKGANSERCSNQTFFKICCRSCKAYVDA